MALSCKRQLRLFGMKLQKIKRNEIRKTKEKKNNNTKRSVLNSFRNVLVRWLFKVRAGDGDAVGEGGVYPKCSFDFQMEFLFIQIRIRKR